MSEDGKSAQPETLEGAIKIIEQLTAERDEWKSHSREWEQRAKANKDAASERDALQTELDGLVAEMNEGHDESGQLQKRLEDLESALAAEKDGRKTAEMTALRTRIGTDKGVPTHLIDRLRGEDEASIAEDADAVVAGLPKLPTKPGVPGQGKQGEPLDDDKKLAAFVGGLQLPTEQKE